MFPPYYPEDEVNNYACNHKSRDDNPDLFPPLFLRNFVEAMQRDKKIISGVNTSIPSIPSVSEKYHGIQTNAPVDQYTRFSTDA